MCICSPPWDAYNVNTFAGSAASAPGGVGLSYDVVIIGAGHNGLIAGCYLARAGLKVAVVEAADRPGGMSSSAPLIAAAPDHLINPCAVELVFIRASGIIEELGLDRFGLRMVDVDPPLAYLHEDGASLALWRDPCRTAAEIERFSKQDAEAYLGFARVLDAVLDLMLPLMRAHPLRPSPRTVRRLVGAGLRQRKRLSEVAAFISAPAAQVVDEWFRHPLVRDALIGVSATAARPTDDSSTLPLLFLAFLRRVGAGRPIGGMQALPDALVRCFETLGGTVLAGRAVEEILISSGRAIGVRLTDGQELRAGKAVLATCHPKVALGRLLPGGALDQRYAARVAHLPGHRDGGAWMKLDIALSGRLRLDRHQSQRHDDLDLRLPSCIIGSYDAGIESWRFAAAGELPPRIGMYAVVPTATDPSQAPTGQDTLYLWGSPIPASPAVSWSSLGPVAAKRMVTQAGEYYSGIEQLEIGRWVETPDDAVARLSVPGGSLAHVDFSLLRVGPLRPAVGLSGYQTPISGLFLGGNASHPGVGVSGLPGKLAAAAVLRTR